MQFVLCCRSPALKQCATAWFRRNYSVVSVRPNCESTRHSVMAPLQPKFLTAKREDSENQYFLQRRTYSKFRIKNPAYHATRSPFSFYVLQTPWFQIQDYALSAVAEALCRENPAEASEHFPCLGIFPTPILNQKHAHPERESHLLAALFKFQIPNWNCAENMVQDVPDGK